MPCWELFEEQTQEYRDSVLPPTVTARLAVEAGRSTGWARWVGLRGAVVGLDRFGASAPTEVVMKEFGFTAEAVAAAAEQVVSDSPPTTTRHRSTERRANGAKTRLVSIGWTACP